MINFNPYSIVLLTGVVIVIGYAVIAWLRGTAPIRKYLALTNATIAIYLFGYGMELSQVSVEGVLFWAKFEYIGIAFIPMALIAIVMAFTDRGKWIHHALLIIFIPIITVVLAFTNERHHWIWQDLTLKYTKGIYLAEFTGGWWYWVFAAFLYVSVAFSFWLLLIAYQKSSPFFRSQIMVLLVSIAIPVFLTLLYHSISLLGLPLLNINWQAFAFIITSLLLTAGIINFHLFDLAPIAHDAIFESMTDLVIVLDDQNRVIDFNPAAAKFLNWKIKDVTGTKIKDYIHPPMLPLYQKYAHIEQAQEEIRIFDRYFDMSLTTFKKHEKSRRGRLVVLHEITESVHDRQQILLQATAMDAVDNAIMITDMDGTIVWGNEGLYQMTGYSKEELIGNRPIIFRSGKYDDAFYDDLWTTIRSGQKWHGQFTNRHKNGSLYIQEVGITPVLNEAGNVRHFVSIMQDVSERVKAEKKLEYLATHDVLTDLPNRMLFKHLLKHAMQHANRHNAKVGILFIDIDKFKSINDQLGHDFGDKILQKVAQVLKMSVRESDTICRWGGDEFVIVLENLYDKKNITAVVDKISEIMDIQVPLNKRLTDLALSIGVSVYPDDNKEMDILLSYADQAMYAAKNNPATCCEYYSQLKRPDSTALKKYKNVPY